MIEQHNNLSNEDEIKIIKRVVHYARVYNYNDETYKWRPVIPIKKVYNSWVVIPLFTEKKHFNEMDNYLLIDELSVLKQENVYVDLSRQDKILISKENFKSFPLRFKENKWHKVKKSTIKLIEVKQNIYIYDDLALVKERERTLNFQKNLVREVEDELEFID